MPDPPSNPLRVPDHLQVQKLQRWYRRGYNDGKAGRPAMDLKGLSELEALAYTTGRADGAAVMKNQRSGER